MTEQEKIVAVTQLHWKAEDFKQLFFNKLFDYLMYEQLPPDGFVLAYGGYADIDNLVNAVRSWYSSVRETTSWHELPRVLLNHRMFMFRHYNEFHCAEFDYPSLFLMSGLTSVFARDMTYPATVGSAADLLPYFGIPRVVGDEHPRNSPTYRIWSIPLDDSGDGIIEKIN